MKMLITGFEPFSDYPLNSSGLVVQSLRGTDVEGIELDPVILPVSFIRAFETIRSRLETFYRGIILFGMSAGDFAIRIERLAVNLKDATIPDVDGEQPYDTPLSKDGPAAYFTSLDNRAIAEQLRAAGYQTKLSMSAGTYVCNALLYLLLHHLNCQNLNIPTGFIHLPAPIAPAAAFPAQVPRLGLDSLREAARIAIRTGVPATMD